MPGSAGCEPDLGGGHTFPAVSLPLLVSGIAFKRSIPPPVKQGGKVALRQGRAPGYW